MAQTPRTATACTRVTACALAIVAAVAIAAPAAAQGGSGWPVHGQDGANTRQADVDGISDPGLRWVTDLTDLGYEQHTFLDGGHRRNAPLVGPDGLVLRRAWNLQTEQADVLALDDEGELAWTVADVSPRCGLAVDRQDRIWVHHPDGADSSPDGDVLRAYDGDGEAIAGTQVDLDDLDLGGGDWCSRISLHVGGAAANETLVLVRTDGRAIVAVDVSGPNPAVAWELDVDDVPFDQVRRSTSTGAQPIIAAFSDDAVFVPTTTGDAAAMTELSLADGSIGRAAPIEVPATPGSGESFDQSAIHSTQVMVLDGHLVVGARTRPGNSYSEALGGVYGFDLGGDLTTAAWERTHRGRTSTADAGPSLMAASGTTVVYNTNEGALHGVEVTTGTATDWSGELAVRELGGGVSLDLLTDAAGGLYTAVVPDTAQDTRVVRYSPAGQTTWSVSRNAFEFAAVDPGQNVRIAAMGPDGTLHLYADDLMLALDGSGGLSECQLPFDDVREANTHAVRICELAQAQITLGDGQGNYDPSGDVTREQMATFLARTLELDPVAGSSFPDVPEGTTHAGAIEAIREAGITQGRPDGTYDPRGTVTRAQMASFLANAADLDGVDGSGFTDVDLDGVHGPNIYAVRDAGIAQGTTPSTYAPGDDVRRDQMASFLMRMVDLD